MCVYLYSIGCGRRIIVGPNQSVGGSVHKEEKSLLILDIVPLHVHMQHLKYISGEVARILRRIRYRYVALWQVQKSIHKNEYFILRVLAKKFVYLRKREFY